MSRQYLHITIMQTESGYAVKVAVADVNSYRGGHTPNMPALANGQHLDADAAAATVTAALEQWSEHEQKEGWTE